MSVLITEISDICIRNLHMTPGIQSCHLLSDSAPSTGQQSFWCPRRYFITTHGNKIRISALNPVRFIVEIVHKSSFQERRKVSGHW